MTQTPSGGTAQPPFNPNDNLTDLQGKKYLEVKWRLLWIDQVCHWFKITIIKSDIRPDLPVEKETKVWNPETRKNDLIKTVYGKGWAYYEVEVEDDRGRVGQAGGSETVLDFYDYIEKANTKAVGRALALIGYGTQHAPEFDEGDRIVDAPVQTQPTQTDPPTGGGTKVKATAPVATEVKTETEKKKPITPVTPTPTPKPAPKPVIVPSPASELDEIRQTVIDTLTGNAGPYEQRAILIYWKGEGTEKTEPLSKEEEQKLLKEDAFFTVQTASKEWKTVQECQQILDTIGYWQDDKEDGHLHWTGEKILPEQQIEIVKRWGSAFGTDAIKTLKAEQFGAADTTVSNFTRGTADKMVTYLRTARKELVNGKIVPKAQEREKVTLAA